MSTPPQSPFAFLFNAIPQLAQMLEGSIGKLETLIKESSERAQQELTAQITSIRSLIHATIVSVALIPVIIVSVSIALSCLVAAVVCALIPAATVAALPLLAGAGTALLGALIVFFSLPLRKKS
jgi:hypothetical protein